MFSSLIFSTNKLDFVNVINENGFIDHCNTHLTEKVIKKSHSLYHLLKNSSENMKNEFLFCLEAMMDARRISIENELDIISAKNPIDKNDTGPASHMVKLIKYNYHI